MVNPDNIRISLIDGGRFRVEWDFESWRYWYLSEDANLDPLPRYEGGSACIYRRPLDGMGVPDKVKPQLLKFLLPTNRRMVAAVTLEIQANGLLQLAQEADAEKKALEVVERARAVAEKAKQAKFGSRGLALLETLQHIARISKEPAITRAAREAIAKAGID